MTFPKQPNARLEKSDHWISIILENLSRDYFEVNTILTFQHWWLNCYDIVNDPPLIFHLSSVPLLFKNTHSWRICGCSVMEQKPLTTRTENKTKYNSLQGTSVPTVHTQVQMPPEPDHTQLQNSSKLSTGGATARVTWKLLRFKGRICNT